MTVIESQSAEPARIRNPFIAGSWVRAENFYGRRSVLSEILDGPRDALWVVGARRLGKTSVLKELELLTQQSPHTPFVPLYWDLEGCGSPRGLAEGLLTSVEDSESFRRATDLAVEELDGLSVTDMLTTLIRRTVRTGWRLLLLLDEGEELLTIAKQDVGTLLRLRRVIQRGPEMRTVLTSTRRLRRIDERAEYSTSPFLQAFGPPLYLAPLAAEEARALLLRGNFAREETDLMMERTANHPFLLQLIASRHYDNRDLAATLDQVASDEMVSNFFSVDFETLESAEKRILDDVAGRPEGLSRADLARTLGQPEEQIDPLLFALKMMGYLASDDSGRYRAGNYFFERWLRRTSPVLASQTV